MERCDTGLSFRIIRSYVHEHADAPNTLRLLRTRRERRRCRRAAEQGDELASPHVQLSAGGCSLPYRCRKCRVVHHSELWRPMSEMGHVWTAPAVQEESDYQRSVRVRSCIRPVVAWRITSVAMQPPWPLALM